MRKYIVLFYNKKGEPVKAIGPIYANAWMVEQEDDVIQTARKGKYAYATVIRKTSKGDQTFCGYDFIRNTRTPGNRWML